MKRLILCILLTLTLPAVQCLQGQEMKKPYANSHFITADSILFHYRTWNDSLPAPRGKVVIVHGFYGSTFCFRKQFDTLAGEGYRVVAVDLPGYGYSDRNPAINQSTSNRARFLWDLLDLLDQGDTARWNIIGHSMGGGIAEGMALYRPERTKSLMIIDGMVFNRNRNLVTSLSTQFRMTFISDIQVSYTRKKISNYDYFRRKLKGAYRRMPDSTEVMGYFTPMQLPGTAETVVSNFDNAKEICRLDADSLAGMPVCVVWGSKDKTIPYFIGWQFVRKNPGVELIKINGAGHIPMETHPAEFNVILTEFLGRNNP
jgi:2-hydroxy-6-oxonona-2,4-dienedioate hydrolase